VKQSTKKTGNNYLLDTSIIIEIFNGNVKVADRVNSLKKFAVSTIVLGELYTGINRVVNKAKHQKMLNDFLQLCQVMDVDSNTSKHYGEIMSQLHKKGKPIPTKDVWIAALSIQHKHMLITTDKHFNEIDGINVARR